MKLFRVIMLIIFINLFANTVSAHPGKTDGSGGHRNSSTGEYHYHHGYSAHSHQDIDKDGVLDCPYDFDDKTDHYTSNNNSRSSNSKTVPSNENSSNSKTSKPKVTFWNILFSVLEYVIEAIAIGFMTSYVLSWILLPLLGDEKGCAGSFISFCIISTMWLIYQIYQIFK